MNANTFAHIAELFHACTCKFTCTYTKQTHVDMYTYTLHMHAYIRTHRREAGLCEAGRVDIEGDIVLDMAASRSLYVCSKGS
jgi:hypothetical protein